MADIEPGDGPQASAEASIDDSGSPVVTITGEVDLSNADDIAAVIEPAISAGADRLVVDVSDLGFMDSSGIALLLRYAQRVRRVELRNPSAIICRTVESMSLSDVLHLETMRHVRSFAGDVSSVSAARRFATESLDHHVPRGTLDEIALMVSELATNCVRFAPGDFSVSIEDTSEQIRVEVTDDGLGEPTVRSPRPDEVSGRGLRLVQAMSGAWGVESRMNLVGKTVWFTVPYSLPEWHTSR